MLINGCLIEGFVPRQLIENESIIVLYYSTEPFPNASRMELEFPKIKFLYKDVDSFNTLKEIYYCKLAP